MITAPNTNMNAAINVKKIIVPVVIVTSPYCFNLVITQILLFHLPGNDPRNIPDILLSF